MIILWFFLTLWLVFSVWFMWPFLRAALRKRFGSVDTAQHFVRRRAF